MNFLYTFFQSDTFLWALVGIPSLMGFLVLMRLMRSGRKSFEERHAAMDARILQTAQDMEELNKTMHKSEHLHIVATALREAIAYPAHKENTLSQPTTTPLMPAHVQELPNCVKLHTPNTIYSIVYTEKKQYLHSTQKTVRGHGYFEVRQSAHSLQSTLTASAYDKAKIFYDLCTLEHYILQRLCNQKEYKGPPGLRQKT